MNIDLLSLVGDFRIEVEEHLNALDEQLLRLERDPSATQPVRAMFLAAHSIKGGAAMLGMVELRDLAHALEDVLGVLRDDKRKFERAIADVLFRGVDRLRAIAIAMDGTPRPATAETLALVAELANCTVTSPMPSLARTNQERRVLLVEDSPSVRQVETFLLQDAGYVVDSAASGEAALARAQQLRYVLVIAGVETRELRGPDLVSAIRDTETGPPVPVVLTTTDYGSASPTSIPDVVYASKGRLGNPDFVRVVRDLTDSVTA